jgi:acetolactate synthase-1/2/3 large subunit
MSNQKQSSVSRAIVDYLVAEEARFVFGLAGSHILPIVDCLSLASDIRHVVVKHENSAAVMAGMFGYLTGRPGVALVTAGPGAAQCVSGIAQAYVSSNPMVLISGGVPVGSTSGAYHGVDREDFMQKIYQPVTKRAFRVSHPDQVADTLAQAFSLASSGRPGPVFVEFPLDILQDGYLTMRPFPMSSVQKQVPQISLVDATLIEIARSQRPIICAGRGVLAHHAEAELLTLSERLGAPVFWTSHADGVMPEGHPLAVGSFDQWTENPLAWELAEESDLLLVVGMRSTSPHSKLLGKHAPDSTIFVSLDESDTFNPVAFAHMSAAADSQLFLSIILDRLPTQDRHPDPAVVRRIERRRRAFILGRNGLIKSHKKANPMHFGLVLEALASQVETEAIVVAGIGNHSAWARVMFSPRDRNSFLAMGPWGTMGAELAEGLCAKLVFPGRQVIIITGDGSLLMAMSDLVTVAETGANVLIVVLNDSRYGMITAMQTDEFGRSFGDQIGKVNFAKQAEALGLTGIRVERAEDLREAVRRSIELLPDGPIVLDAVCNHTFGWPEREILVEEGLTQLETLM